MVDDFEKWWGDRMTKGIELSHQLLSTQVANIAFLDLPKLRRELGADKGPEIVSALRDQGHQPGDILRAITQFGTVSSLSRESQNYIVRDGGTDEQGRRRLLVSQSEVGVIYFDSVPSSALIPVVFDVAR